MTQEQIAKLQKAIRHAEMGEISDNASVKEAEVNLSALATALAEAGLVAGDIDFMAAVRKLVQDGLMSDEIEHYASEVEDRVLQAEYRLSARDDEAINEATSAYATLIDALASWAGGLNPAP